jgi:hypothetical protein
MGFGSAFGKLTLGLTGGGGGGDPTALTVSNADAFLTALGLTQAGTGTTYGETGQAATPLYAVAANKVPLACETVLGRKWFGPIVNPAGTNLVTRSRNLASIDWVKTGCTALRAHGDLVSTGDGENVNLLLTSDSLGQFTDVGRVTVTTATGAAPDGSDAKLLTETVDVGSHRIATPSPYLSIVAGLPLTFSCYLKKSGTGRWALLAMTDADGGHQVRCWFDLQTGALGTAANVGSGSGATGSIESIGDGWYRCAVSGITHVGGTGNLFAAPLLASADGVLSYAGDTGRALLCWGAQIEDGLSVSRYLSAGATALPFHTLLTATADNATATFPITSTSGERVSKSWLSRGSGTGTVDITQDDGSTWAEVTLTSDPQPFNVAAATLADPDVGIRIGTDGDTVRVYGVSHQVAARTMRPFTEHTAGSSATVSGRSLTRTLSVAPSAVDVSMVVVVPSYAAWCWQIDDGGDTSDRIALLFDASQNLVLRKGASTDQTVAAALTPGDAILIDLQANVTVTRARVDGGSWVDNGTGTVADADTVRFGLDQAAANHLAQPILAFRSGGLLTGIEDWNLSLLDRLEASFM